MSEKKQASERAPGVRAGPLGLGPLLKLKAEAEVEKAADGLEGNGKRVPPPLRKKPSPAASSS